MFDRVRKISPTSLNKLIPLAGDISQRKLGFSEEDWSTLTNKVSIIFHVAATIKFTEPLKTAIRLNVRGTEEVKKLASRCINLTSAVFVGTAYSQFPMDEVLEEKFYKPPITAVDAIKMDDTFSKEEIEENKSKYVYTVIRPKAGLVCCRLISYLNLQTTSKRPQHLHIYQSNFGGNNKLN